MSLDLRIMEIPENRVGLGEGHWLRWGELRLWLLDHDARQLADEIEETIIHGETVLAYTRTVRA